MSGDRRKDSGVGFSFKQHISEIPETAEICLIYYAEGAGSKGKKLCLEALQGGGGEGQKTTRPAQKKGTWPQRPG